MSVLTICCHQWPLGLQKGTLELPKVQLWSFWPKFDQYLTSNDPEYIVNAIKYKTQEHTIKTTLLTNLAQFGPKCSLIVTTLGIFQTITHQKLIFFKEPSQTLFKWNLEYFEIFDRPLYPLTYIHFTISLTPP